MKNFFLLFLVPVFCLFGAFFSFVPSAEAALSLTNGDNATTTPSVATSITGFQIVGPSASTTPVKLRATSGTLNLSTITGVTMSGNGSGTVNLSGTVEKLNQALATLTYTRASTGTDTLEVSLVEASEVFFPDNNHLYEYIASSGTWNAAKIKAEALTRYGATGYLTTILTADENTFVAARLGGDGWMGASDVTTEGDWKWVTGPEAGTSFWSGTSGGSVVGGNYANWNSGEPNNSGDEDCAQFYSTGVQSGKWNDLPCSSTSLPGYVAEFGSDDDPLTVVAAQISIVTANVPAVTSLSPANSSTTVSVSTNLVIGFSKSVTAGTGNILLKKSSDDSIAETIDVTSGQVTGGGSSSITINPSITLAEGTSYYVIVPSTAFKDSSDNYFDGISNNSTWAFTTGDETAPTFSSITATVNSSTTASVTWTTNESASTQVVYGPTNAYGLLTSTTDSSPRVTSHTVALSSLLSCTLYHYAVVSVDGFSNTATSTDQTFTTEGCSGEADPDTATTTSITSSAGGSTRATGSNNTITVSLPENATATSSTVVIQIKSLPKSPVLTSIGRPTAAPNEGSSVVFDVKAIIDGNTILDSFDAPVTITYQYTDPDISGLDESSLWLYHYHNDVWEALSNCTLNTSSNTINCTTTSFSVFGLFGTQAATANISGGYTLEGQIAIALREGNTAKAYELLVKYIKQFFGVNLPNPSTTTLAETPVLPSVSTSTYNFSRDLNLRMEGEDVKQLQEFLIKSAAGPAAKELVRLGASGFFGRYTENALIEYQTLHNISPASGYFGPLTREYISVVR